MFMWDPTARVQLRAIDRQTALHILQALNRYASTGEGDVKALHGPLAGTLRLRVGPYRIQFRFIEGRAIRVLAVEKRGDAYRD